MEVGGSRPSSGWRGAQPEAELSRGLSPLFENKPWGALSQFNLLCRFAPQLLAKGLAGSEVFLVFFK